MFQPVVISSGVTGWAFLKETYDRQLGTFTKSPELKRDSDYFADKIGAVKSAEELVSDRRLLTVVLGAFGLQDDINNRFFIKKMLSEGTTADDSLANQFTDTRYKNLSAAFGFGPGEVPRNNFPGFADEIIAKYEANSFEIALGNQDETMRIALFAERMLADVVGGNGTVAAKWFSIMGQPPLRSLFETALGLPKAFGQIDIDQQLDVFQDRAKKLLGVSDPIEFTDREKLDTLITSYLARSQLTAFDGGTSSGAIALTLLSS